MSNKYSRNQPSISRHADEDTAEDHWLKQFQNKLEKGAVQPKHIQESLFDQINSIMNGKSKHSSVADAVKDMQERSGLTAYLDKINKTSTEDPISKKKVASDQNESFDKDSNATPIVMKKVPAIKDTLERYIKETNGNLPIPAIIEKIKYLHHKDISEAKDWEDNNLIRLVSQLNLKAKKDNSSTNENYSNLGAVDRGNDSEIDPANTDAFISLNPVKL